MSFFTRSLMIAQDRQKHFDSPRLQRSNVSIQVVQNCADIVVEIENGSSRCCVEIYICCKDDPNVKQRLPAISNGVTANIRHVVIINFDVHDAKWCISFGFFLFGHFEYVYDIKK